MGEKTLKEKNGLRLTIVAMANALAFYGASATHSFSTVDWSTAEKALEKLIPAGVGAVLVGVLNAQLDATAKARIVFLRWNQPLPGAEAFTKLAPRDARIDIEGLKKRVGELPTEPSKQNAVWYGLYREVAKKPSILHAHQEYLFTRDYHVFALGILILAATASIWAVTEPRTRILYVSGLLLQALLTGQAARNHGRRLVCSVLAMITPSVPKPKRATKRNSD